MTSTKVLIVSTAVAVAAVTGIPAFAAGGGPASGVRLKTISSRIHAKGASLVIEATEPVPYVASRPDALTVLLDLRDVASDGVANKVARATGPIARVALEATDFMGTPVSRVRVSLTEAVAYRVRSERNTIVVDFDRIADRSVSVAPIGSGKPPDAMQALAKSKVAAVDAILALALSTPAPILPAGTAALLTLDSQQQPTAPPPATVAASSQDQPKKYTGELSNWSLEDADVLGVLKLIQDISGLNMVFDPGISGKVSLVLTQVPWDQLLDVVLKQAKLGVVVEDTIVRVAPLSVLSDEQVQRRKLADEQALSGQLVTVNKTLSYSRAADMPPLLKNLLSTRGQIYVDDRTNTLIVTDLQGRLDNVWSLVGQLDRAQPQVEIEARIIQTSTDNARQLGVRWGFNGRADAALGNTTNLAFPNNGSLGGRLGSDEVRGGTAVNLAVPATSAVGLALGSVNGAFNLDVELTALERAGTVKLLSTPKVSTLNNVEAEIAQGVQVPYQTSANNTVVTGYKDAALILKVKPQITTAGTVIMNISVDNGSVGEIFPDGVSINTQRANTTVLVNDGETTVIAGIYQGNQAATNNRTPGLSRIPILGWLFKNEILSEQNKELLIFITPRIIK